MEFLQHTRRFEQSLGALWKREDEEGQEEEEEERGERNGR
jgi:hypothetical protein